MVVPLVARMRAPVLLVMVAFALIPDCVAAEKPGATAPALQARGATKSFDILVAEHRAIRAKLDESQRATLDELAGRFRKVLVGRRLRKGLWDSTIDALKASGMSLNDQEHVVLATYVLDGIAAQDDLTGLSLDAETRRRAQAVQQSFNLQYLELQSQMQGEARSYEQIRNIMAAKHDTVKNSIANVR